VNNHFAFLPMKVANGLLDDVDALRAQLAEEGYLYFEQLLDREAVHEVRRDVLGVLADLGWTEPNQIPRSNRCIVPPLREEDEAFIEGYQEVQKLESFHTLAHHPALMDAMRKALGPTAFPHPLKIARLAFPGHYEVSTPPHQDYPNNQGTPELTAAWIPLSDLGTDLGGLAVLRGSNRYGLLPMRGHIGAGNRMAAVPEEMAEACRWVTTEFHQGDVLLFPATTVHASLHNASMFDMRLSVDFRYQQEGQALTPGCLLPHFQRLTWEEIYAGWSSTEFQYYWRDLDYEVVPFERLPVEGADGTTDLRPEDVRAILQYQARVEERTAGRLAALHATGPNGPT
jgi:ectoine hydroxylase-related dioxygenase (phytanoyl-CoA dioxygenase family)